MECRSLSFGWHHERPACRRSNSFPWLSYPDPESCCNLESKTLDYRRSRVFHVSLVHHFMDQRTAIRAFTRLSDGRAKIRAPTVAMDPPLCPKDPPALPACTQLYKLLTNQASLCGSALCVTRICLNLRVVTLTNPTSRPSVSRISDGPFVRV
jgi:hypothetical protein